MAKYWCGITSGVKFQIDLPSWRVSFHHESLLKGAGRFGESLQIIGGVTELSDADVAAVRAWIKSKSVKFRPDGVSLLVARDADLAPLESFVWLKPYRESDHASMAKGQAVPSCLADEVTA